MDADTARASAPVSEHNAKVAVAAIIFDDLGRVLLIERGRPPGLGLWTVPGGRLEFGESLAAALRREVEEETGLLVEIGALVAVVERIGEGDSAGYHYVILDYLARCCGGTLRAGSDARQARFCGPPELAILPLTEGLVPVIEKARALRSA
jgi:8-oxo-dGTP diphosphatase